MSTTRTASFSAPSLVALLAALGAATASDAAFMVNQDPGSQTKRTVSSGGMTYLVALDPSPTTQLAPGATAAHRTVLNDTFDGKDAAGNDDATVDWDFLVGGGLDGAITVVQYDAAELGTTGGAIMEATYNGAGAPTNLWWLQIIDTDAPLGGTTSPYVDPRPNDDNLPFYFTQNEVTNGFPWQTATGQAPAFTNPAASRTILNPDANTDLVFLDFSKRLFTSAPVDWDAYLYLVTWDGAFGGDVTIHDGIQWGFTIAKIPEPATWLLLTVACVYARSHRL